MTAADPLVLLSPLIVTAVGAMVVMLLDAFGRPRLAVWSGALVLVLASGLAAWTAYTAEQVVLSDVLLLGAGISAAMMMVFVLSAAAVVGGAQRFALDPSGPGSVALILLSAAGGGLLVASLDLVITLIALETMAVCAYALVVTMRTPAAMESSMKYFVQGAIATGMFVMGVAIASTVFGSSTSYIRIGQGMLLSSGLPATLAATLLMTMFAFKLGALPFHSWAPDVFETAPPASAGFLASATKVAAIAGAFLLFGVSFAPGAAQRGSMDPSTLFALLAAGSIVYGNLAALKQTSFSRMLGYSGIAQVGYALVGLTLGVAAMPATMLFVSAYGVAVLAAFLAAEFAGGDSGWDGSISGLRDLARRNAAVGVALAVALFSLTGIPLTAGFLGKLLVFSLAVQSGYTWLAVVGLIGSVVSFGYYGGVLRAVYFDAGEGEREIPADSEPRGGAMVATVALAVILLAAGIVPLLTGTEQILRFFAVG